MVTVVLTIAILAPSRMQFSIKNSIKAADFCVAIGEIRDPGVSRVEAREPFAVDPQLSRSSKVFRRWT